MSLMVKKMFSAMVWKNMVLSNFSNRMQTFTITYDIFLFVKYFQIFYPGHWFILSILNTSIINLHQYRGYRSAQYFLTLFINILLKITIVILFVKYFYYSLYHLNNNNNITKPVSFRIFNCTSADIIQSSFSVLKTS